ncbi:unnamed protein product [Rotaria socialis]|uniref:Uncharacterized protein n=1 Tax=Rotaria socialis TaxID=392032 RepID=A0A821NNH7_9BILA|nr:unnamed protein product [Rotaria socialis]
MANYNLYLTFNHKFHHFVLNSNMSLSSIKVIVGEKFGINPATFEIQVQDKYYRETIVLDNEYLGELHERLHLRYMNTIYGDILLDHQPANYYDWQHCMKKVKHEDSTIDLLYKPNSTKSETRIQDVINIIYGEEKLASSPEELSISTSSEIATLDAYKSDESIDLTNCSRPLMYENPFALRPPNNDLILPLCALNTSIAEETSETSFQSYQNELGLTEKINFGVPAVADNLKDTLINPPPSNEAIPTGTLCPGIYERIFDYPTLPLLDHIAQPATSLPLSASLKIAHDVQPYQNIQHDTNISDDFIDRNRSPYVMRIQGIKTQADKGKSILPRIKIPARYIFLNQQSVHDIYLMVAVVHEEKVDNKRNFYTSDDIQFLPPGAKKHTDGINPIQLNLNSLQIQSDGTCGLSLRLMNRSWLSKTKTAKMKVFYQLNEDTVKNLHHAEFDQRSIRLACILIQNKKIEWDTFCLSDYIRPKK